MVPHAGGALLLHLHDLAAGATGRNVAILKLGKFVRLRMYHFMPLLREHLLANPLEISTIAHCQLFKGYLG